MYMVTFSENKVILIATTKSIEVGFISFHLNQWYLEIPCVSKTILLCSTTIIGNLCFLPILNNKISFIVTVWGLLKIFQLWSVKSVGDETPATVAEGHDLAVKLIILVVGLPADFLKAIFIAQTKCPAKFFFGLAGKAIKHSKGALKSIKSC